jgi:uncharacterized protein YggE
MRLLRVAIACLFGCTAPVLAQDSQQSPVIVTTGQAELKMAPDRAWVTIVAESRSKDPKEAQRLNVAAMTAVMEKLKGMNLGTDAFQTTTFELRPEFDHDRGKQILRGYLARNAIEVRVDDIARAGDVLGTAVESGATSVGGLRFDLKDRDAAEREALRLAVRDARGRADAAASGAGVQIARVQKVEEQRMGPEPPRPMMRQMPMESAAVDMAPPITPGTIEIRSTVTMTVLIR